MQLTVARFPDYFSYPVCRGSIVSARSAINGSCRSSVYRTARSQQPYYRSLQRPAEDSSLLNINRRLPAEGRNETVVCNNKLPGGRSRRDRNKSQAGSEPETSANGQWTRSQSKREGREGNTVVDAVLNYHNTLYNARAVSRDLVSQQTRLSLRSASHHPLRPSAMCYLYSVVTVIQPRRNGGVENSTRHSRQSIASLFFPFLSFPCPRSR